MTSSFNVVSSAEWSAAREVLRAQEAKEATTRAAVNAARRRMPVIKLEKEYSFDSPEGDASLLDIFDGQRQLIVYHFMFDPTWDEGCRFCSHVIDNVGHLAHLRALDTSFAAISRAPLSKIERFKARMGWSIPWYSSHHTDFNDDFQATHEGWERGGMSVFLCDEEEIFHAYSAFDDEVDLQLLDSSYVDLAPLGLRTDRPWPLHHDSY